MIEKSGKIIISERELSEIKFGNIPDRIAAWGLSLDELNNIISSRNYRVIDENFYSVNDEDIENNTD